MITDKNIVIKEITQNLEMKDLTNIEESYKKEDINNELMHEIIMNSDFGSYKLDV